METSDGHRFPWPAARVIAGIVVLVSLVLAACAGTGPTPQPTTVSGTSATVPAGSGTGASSELPSYPAPPQQIPAGVLPPQTPIGSYVALAWNDLGMHCAMPDYSLFFILPPYNVLWTQVIHRGGEPRITTNGVEVAYAVPQVTHPEQHNDFWDYAAAYGYDVEPGVGISGVRTSGTMVANQGYFEVVGVPVVDRNDDGVWDPYPMFTVDVTSGGQVVAQTVNVAPVSTEMRCDFCHAAGVPNTTMHDVEADILRTHDAYQDLGLLAQAEAGNLVVCNRCHADPALGVAQNHDATTTLSGAMHAFHADKMDRPQVPDNACTACHPGPVTQCQRGAMARAGITCQDCHGTLADVGDPARTPWVNLPRCQSCHTDQLVAATLRTIDSPNTQLTADASALYRNSRAHGENNIYCPACHGSPHAIYASTVDRDNVQSMRLQGFAGTISDCTVCHTGQPEGSFYHLRGRGD